MPGLRISGGELRGRVIPLPRTELRPTSSRARQAFFDIVSSRIADSTFVDLFAGSGIFSFEAVSRGARKAFAVEQSRRSVLLIERTARKWNVPVSAVASDVFAALKRLPGVSFDIVYGDPPYDWSSYPQLLEALDRDERVGEHAIVALEHRRGTTPFSTATLRRLEPTRTVAYSDVAITFFAPGRAM